VKIEGKVTDNSKYLFPKKNISVQADGKALDFTFNPTSGEIDAYFTPEIKGDIHKITVTATDYSGNKKSASVTFKAPGAGDGAVFQDTTAHWAKDYIAYLANQSVVKGEVENNINYYRPDRTLTRAEFAIIISNFQKLDVEAAKDISVPFKDTKNIPSWAADYVKAVYQAGYMNGKTIPQGGVIFDPLATVTRAEVMKVLGTISEFGYPLGDFNYTDVKDVPSWAEKYARLLTAKGIIGGYEDGTLKPTYPVTRAETAKMLCGLY
jgi:hypothetical protein